MTTWMKHFQGNINWAPYAGEGGLAFVGRSLGTFANSDHLQNKNLNLNNSRGGELTTWGWPCLLESSGY